MDFVKIKHGRRAEALYYFENNWKVYRDAALKKGYITSYSILATPADSAAGFDLVLITEYADSVQYNLSEARFEPIIKELRPNGPKLLNQVKPNDFRQNVFFKRATTVVHSAPREWQAVGRVAHIFPVLSRGWLLIARSFQLTDDKPGVRHRGQAARQVAIASPTRSA